MKIDLHNKDCFEVMDKMISDGIKVDMILSDLPYAETGSKWDNKLLPTDKIFEKFEQLITDEGAIVMTATMKFAVELITHAKHLYKYDWIWEKASGTNPQNVNYQPFRNHEIILVFGKGRVSYGTRTPMKYNPQKTFGHKAYEQKSGKMGDGWKGGLKNVVTKNEDGSRHPKTVQKFVSDKGFHPTQKPVKLFELLIQSYTNEGDLVFDPTLGSGTTAVACKQLNRNCIGSELDEKYYKICQDRLKNTIQGCSLDTVEDIQIKKEDKNDIDILF